MDPHTRTITIWTAGPDYGQACPQPTEWLGGLLASTAYRHACQQAAGLTGPVADQTRYQYEILARLILAGTVDGELLAKEIGITAKTADAYWHIFRYVRDWREWNHPEPDALGGPA